MTKSCNNCTKAVRTGGKPTNCHVLTDMSYPWIRYGDCWAWSDDELWEDRIKLQIKEIYGPDAVRYAI